MNFDRISISLNKDKLAIVVVGYNRLDSLSRLLESINRAHYETDDIPLVISIDASGNQDLYEYVKRFTWDHGDKYVNIQKERLGLKTHIFQCASLSKFFKGVIVLEDDLVVAPYFYNYSIAVLNKYEKEDRVVGISLYSEETQGFVGLPFQPLQNGSDVFAWQTVCSWGEIWTYEKWEPFQKWLSEWKEDFSSIDMPATIKGWTRAWSKYMYAYMIANDKYFIYPYISLTTNFNDQGGEHGGGDASIVQVSLLQGLRDYSLFDFDDLIFYDVYSQNMNICNYLGIHKEDLTVDYYGLKDVCNTKYLLTPFKLPHKIIKGFSLSMRPWELNILYQKEGKDIYLYEIDSYPISLLKSVFPLQMGYYYLRGFNSKLLLKIAYRILLRKVWNVVKIK